MRNLSILFPRILLSLGAVPVAIACGGSIAAEDSDSREKNDAGEFDNDGGDDIDARRQDEDGDVPQLPQCLSAVYTCTDGTTVSGPAVPEKQATCGGDPKTTVFAGQCSTPGCAAIDYCETIAPWDATKCGEGGLRKRVKDCDQTYRQMPCSIPFAATTNVPPEVCDKACPDDLYGNASSFCSVVAHDGGLALSCQVQCGVGRRPNGLVEQVGCGDNATGRLLAKLVELEAASVDAFEILGNEFAFHGGPRALLRRIEVARRDEIRHTRAMTRLAIKHGGVPIEPVVTREKAPRSVFQLALENAVEGCVRETFGALVAHHQAENAEDADVKYALRVIARDETKHAELSWSIHAWAVDRLSSEERISIEIAMKEAIASLEQDESEEGAETLRLLGLPTRAARAHLVDAMKREVWAIASPQINRAA